MVTWRPNRRQFVFSQWRIMVHVSLAVCPHTYVGCTRSKFGSKEPVGEPRPDLDYKVGENRRVWFASCQKISIPDCCASVFESVLSDRVRVAKGEQAKFDSRWLSAESQRLNLNWECSYSIQSILITSLYTSTCSILHTTHTIDIQPKMVQQKWRSYPATVIPTAHIID